MNQLLGSSIWEIVEVELQKKTSKMQINFFFVFYQRSKKRATSVVNNTNTIVVVLLFTFERKTGVLMTKANVRSRVTLIIFLSFNFNYSKHHPMHKTQYEFLLGLTKKNSLKKRKVEKP